MAKRLAIQDVASWELIDSYSKKKCFFSLWFLFGLIRTSIHASLLTGHDFLLQ